MSFLFTVVCVWKHVTPLIIFSVSDQVIYTDVALDPYSSDGHDGIVREDGGAVCAL